MGVVGRHDLDEAGERSVPVAEDLARLGAAGVELVALDQHAQPLGVVAQHVAHPGVVDVARALQGPPGAVLLVARGADRRQLDLRGVA